MRTRVGRLLALALLLVGTVAYAQNGKTNIGVFIPVLGNAYTKAFTNGIQSVADKHGGAVQVFSGEYNQTKQLNQMQDAITSGRFKAFIVYAINGTDVVSGVDAAVSAGIKVVGADVVIGSHPNSLVPYKGLSGFVGGTGKADGDYIGQLVVMACKDINPCKVAYLIGSQALTIDQDRLTALKAVIATHPSIKLVSVQEGKYLQNVGYNVSQNILQAHPDLNVIASSGDQMTLGAALAVSDLGLKGKVALIGNGASKEGYKAVVDGTLFGTVSNIPYTEGQIAAQMVFDALAGTNYVRSVNTFVQSPPDPPSGPIITKDNAASFQPQW